MKKLISMTLCIAMILSLVALPAGATGTESETDSYIAKAWFGSSDNGKRTVSPNAWTGYNLMSLTDPIVLDANLIANGYVQIKVTTESGTPTVLQLRLNVSPNVESTTTKADVLVDMLQYDPTLASDIGVEKVINIPLKDFKTESGTLVANLLTNAAYGALEGADGKLKLTTTNFKGNSTATAVIAFSELTFWDKEPVIEEPEEDTGKYITSGWFGSGDTGKRTVEPNKWVGYNLMSLTEPIVFDSTLLNSAYVQVNVTTESGTPTELQFKIVVAANVDSPPASAEMKVNLLSYDSSLATDIGKEKLIFIPLKDFKSDSGTALSALLTNTSYGGASGADGKMKITGTKFKGNSSATAVMYFNAVRFWREKPVITVSNQTADSMTISWDTMLYTPGYKVYKDGVAVGEQTEENSMKITGLTAGVKNRYVIKSLGSAGVETMLLEEEIAPMNMLFWRRNMESWANLSADPTLTNAAFATQTWANREGVNTWWANLYSNGNIKLINSNGFGLSNATVNDTVLTFYTKYLDNGTGDFSIAFGYPNAAANAYTWKTVAIDASNLNSSETNPFYDVSEKTNPITGDVHTAGGFTYVSIPLSNMQTTSLDGFTDPNGFDWSKVDRMMFICLSASGGSKASLAFDEVKLTSINPYVKEVKLYDAENEELAAESGAMPAETKKIALSFSRALDERTINGIDVTYNGVSYVASKAYDFFGERVVITLKDELPYGQKLTIDVPNTVQSAPSLGVPVAASTTGAAWGLLSMDATAGNSGNNPVQPYSLELLVEGSVEQALSNACIVETTNNEVVTEYTGSIEVKGSVDIAYTGATAKGIFAIYNADGSLKDIKFVDITATTEAGKKTTEAVTLSNGETASFFVWNGFEGLEPIISGAHIGAIQ